MDLEGKTMPEKFVAYAPGFVRNAGLNAKSILPAIAKNVQNPVKDVQRNVSKWRLNKYKRIPARPGFSQFV
jgi:hypothetical protein